MPRAKLEHVIDCRRTFPVGEPETDFWPSDQAEGGNLQRIEEGSNIVQTPFWSKRVEEAGNIQPSVHRRDRLGQNFSAIFFNTPSCLVLWT